METDLHRVCYALKKVPFCSGLDDDELTAVYQICQPCRYEADDIIFNESDPSHDLYILISGEVSLSTRKKGLIHVIENYGMFGEIGLITKNPRTATAVSTKKTGLLKINHADFNLLMGKHARISAILMRNISQHLSHHIVRMNQEGLEYIPPVKPQPTFSDTQSVILNRDVKSRN